MTSTKTNSAPTRNDLLKEIQELRLRLKRPLTIRDVFLARKRGECSPRHRFDKIFGSVHLAIAEAGAGSEPLDEKEIEKRRQRGWKYVQSAEGKLAEKERMIRSLEELGEKLGRTPQAADIEAASAKGEMLSFADYQRVFGNLDESLRAAGIVVEPPRPADRETLISQLKILGGQLGRMPRAGDIERAVKRGEIAPVSEFLKKFGSYYNFYKAAGWTTRHRTFSEQETAECLRELTRRLKRIPRQKDLQEASVTRNFPSLATVKKRYGGLDNACRVLRLDEIADKTVRTIAPHPKAWAEDEIIESLREMTRKLGYIPRYKDVDDASRRGESPSTTTLEKRFGSFSKALKKARVADIITETPAADWSKYSLKYTEKDIINSLRDLTEHLGRVPTYSDVSEAARLGVCPSMNRIVRKFGTFEKARQAAKLYEMIRNSENAPDSYRTKRKGYTETEVFEMLRRVARRLGHIPTTAEIDTASKRRECPSIRYLKDNFGSIVKVREMARLSEVAPLEHRVLKKYTKNEIIEYLREMTARLRRVPYQTDVDDASKKGLGPGANTIRHHFGTFRKACKAARLSEIAPPQRYAKQAYTKKEIIEKLRELARRLGRVPNFNDVTAASKQGICPGTTTLAAHFGSFTKARQAARLDDVLPN